MESSLFIESYSTFPVAAAIDLPVINPAVAPMLPPKKDDTPIITAFLTPLKDTPPTASLNSFSSRTSKGSLPTVFSTSLSRSWISSSVTSRFNSDLRIFLTSLINSGFLIRVSDNFFLLLIL